MSCAQAAPEGNTMSEDIPVAPLCKVQQAPFDQVNALALDARKGSFPVQRSIYGPEIERVVEVVSLQVALPPNVHVVNDEEFFINMGRSEQIQSGRRPDSRPAPEFRSGDAVSAHGVAGDDPDLVGRRPGREQCLPQRAIVLVRADVHARVISEGLCPP